MVRAAARGQVGICGPCSRRGRALLAFVVYAATWGHVEVHNPCCRWLFWARKLLLSWHRRSNADSQLRMRDIEDLCDCFSPPPPLPILQSPKKKVWTESHWKKKNSKKGAGRRWHMGGSKSTMNRRVILEGLAHFIPVILYITHTPCPLPK